MSQDDVLVKVQNMKKHYPITKGVMRTEIGRARAVDGINFKLQRGETLGLVGESGCGKSTAATTMLQLEEATDGEIIFDGEDITEYDKRELKNFRRRAQMIFQNPDSSFDPRMSIGESIGEPLRIHGLKNRQKRRQIAKNLLDRVGIPPSDVDRYPHEFSGGQKQRVALARALAVNPDMIVADEPASALDVSIQAEILELMRELQDDFGLSILFISHNLGVIRDICDRVAVMYLGEVVEMGETQEIFEDPQHPYTRALLSSVPNADPRQRGNAIELTGDVPNPSAPPSGCRFHTRCPEVIQPDGYDFDQENWRAVMDLRIRLQQRKLDLEAAREFVVTHDEAESVEAVTEEQTKQAIRDEFNLPARLDDSRAQSVLDEALDHIVRDELEDAETLLREEFETVCEVEPPSHLVRDGYNLTEDEWQGITQLLHEASKGSLKAKNLRTSMIQNNQASERSKIDSEMLKQEIYDRTGLSENLNDREADEVVSEALELIASDRANAAVGLLNDEFAPDHSSACHLSAADVSAEIREAVATDD
jgi:peptide/nickel transport system ATP-binding protein